MSVYYNDNDPKVCAWLRELIRAGHLPAGDVDERSIQAVTSNDLTSYSQHHFFSGIGGWPYALALAGWPANLPVWTGSCPCQPFSVAGKREGFSSAHNLWPHWVNLIRAVRPDVIFGEQVASPAGLAWFDVVCTDLEGAGYACGAADLCAAGVGAPHIRQRLFFVADANGGNPGTERVQRSGQQRFIEKNGGTVSLADAGGAGLEILGEQSTRGECTTLKRNGAPGELADACGTRGGRDGGAISSTQSSGESGRQIIGGEPDLTQFNGTDSFWSACEWLPCTDGKSRPVESGSFPLVNGVSGRVGRLRGYGNAIVPQVAAEFIQAYLECKQ